MSAASSAYDIASMQFCMHYAFESPSKARMMLENVSEALGRGRVFTGTGPNAKVLLAKFQDIPENQPRRFGNSVYQVEFERLSWKGMYGHKYRCFITDAVGWVPEYLAHWGAIETYAAFTLLVTSNYDAHC